MTSFNPVIRIGKQITEPLEIHCNISKEEAEKRAIELLELIGIPNAKERMRDYPYQFSGGMRQRAMIAMALICSPKLLIADEPTTALDVTIQAQIVDLVKRLREEIGMAIVWITHDLGVVAGLAQRVIVMYAGYKVEEGSVKTLYAHPRHPYTEGLLGSLPKITSDKKERLVSIDGLPPVLLEKPNKCPFAPRCKYAVEHCWEENPPIREVGDKQKVACWVDIDTGRER
jgi:oligopeptide transport system ATP-binding protein